MGSPASSRTPPDWGNIEVCGAQDQQLCNGPTETILSSRRPSSMLTLQRLAQQASVTLCSALVALFLLLLPHSLFYVTTAVLLLFKGGHRHAILGTNHFCAIPVPHNFSLPSIAPRFSLIIHISDLHVNDIDSGKVKHNLIRFAEHALPKWAPLADAILATGDLVHSVRPNPYPLGRSSAQLDSEWLWLRDYVTRLNASVPWFATYGNHDTFGRRVPAHLMPHSCPHSSSSQSSSTSTHTRVRRFDCADHGPVLLAIDGTPTQPLHSPLNFFGDVSVAAPQLDSSLRHLSSQFAPARPDVIVMSHYPTSTLSHGHHIHKSAFPTDSPPTSHHLPRYAAYLSGHLHNLYGLTKHGLHVATRSGALHLEVPDLGRSATYRIFVLGAGQLAFKTFFLTSDTQSTPSVDEVVFVSPPAAGLCKPGAGHVALNSDHIIMLSPTLNLTEVGTELYIDNRLIGPVKNLSPTCRSETTRQPISKTCDSMYGVEWDASDYRTGTHEIRLSSKMHGATVHVFSLDGQRERSLMAWLRRLIHATFAMSDFEATAFLLCYIGTFVCFAASLPDMLKGEPASFVLPVFSLYLQFGPAFIIGLNLTEAYPGFGFVGMRTVSFGSSIFRGTFDTPFVHCTSVLWPIIVPASLLRRLCIGRWPFGKVSRFVVLPPILFYLRSSLKFSFEVLGAYGRVATSLSPSCVPLLVACCFIAWSTAAVSLTSGRGKQCRVERTVD